MIWSLLFKARCTGRNLSKHTKKGTKISVSAYKTDDSVQFSVKDNDQGIPKEHILMVFQRYPTEKRKIGTGLGLYLSKQIIEAHKGKIWFERERRQGLYFFLYFTALKSSFELI